MRCDSTSSAAGEGARVCALRWLVDHELLGPQKSLLALGAQESENRLLTLMQSFLQSLAKAQPLVLFLDDLQWADHGTLKLRSAWPTSRIAARGCW